MWPGICPWASLVSYLYQWYFYGSKIISSVLFADDTNLFYSHESADILCNTMNRELQKITSCFTSNKLSLNHKETHFMILKTKRKKFKEITAIKINGQIINQDKCTKFLGLNVDDELSWKDHVDQVATKISKMTGIMEKARHYLSIQSLLKTIYNTVTTTPNALFAWP